MAMKGVSQLFPASKGGVDLFDEFFESGMEESISPFLIPNSRKWGKNLSLKSSFIAGGLLLLTFFLSFFPSQSSLTNLCLLFTYFFAGVPALISAIEDIFDLEINIDVLMTLAAFLSILIGSGKEGALLLVLFAFSGAMEEAVRTKAKGAISSLKQLSPTKTFIVQDDGTLSERSVKDVRVGSLIHIKAGQIVPLDGEVIEGASSVNMVHLTGENMPLQRIKGDYVSAGARNLEGYLTVRVTKTSSDSTLARIIQLITQAQEAKPKLQRWLDTVSSRYAMAIILFSLGVAISLPFFLSIPYLGKNGSIYRALAFLIAASPCALIIAIPIAYLSAISSCAKKGILLKGGLVFDALAKCKKIAMDKTGTVTTGELRCTDVTSLKNRSVDQALSVALALERNALHPIARAITRYVQDKKISPAALTDFRAVPGYGLQAKLEGGQDVFIGNADFIFPKMEKSDIVKKMIQHIENKGELFTILLVGRDPYLFQFQDTVRPGIAQTVKKLKDELNIDTLMLTGDHEPSARFVAREIGIQEYYADLRPEDKLNHIGNLAKKEHLAMVGDGINDAPALARASVGISMGKEGSETAIDASDIVLLQDNVELLAWLVRKSRSTVRIVAQNVVIAAGAILIAAIPALIGSVPLWLAVVLHEGGTVCVGLNALRLLKK